MRASALFAAFGLSLTCYSVLAGGEEFRVTTGARGWGPAVAMGPRGDFVITWQGVDAGEDVGIFAQRFDKEANTVGEEFQVNSYSEGEQFDPAVAMDSDGRCVVTWTSNGQDGSLNGVVARRLDEHGNKVGEEFQVNTLTRGSQEKPAVAVDGQGNFTIVWQSLYRGAYGTFGQRFGFDGERLGQEFHVNSSTGLGPALAMHGNGDFVIAWTRSGLEGRGTVAQMFDRQGSKRGPEIRISDGGGLHCAIAMDGEGNFVVAWYGFNGVWAQRFDTHGKRIGREFRVPTVHGSSSAVASDSDGNFIILWTHMDICGQQYDQFGGEVGRVFRIRMCDSMANIYPVLAMSSRGHRVITWSCSTGDSGVDVFARTVFGRDGDGDGLPDEEDNCPSVNNPGQVDSDRDTIGDACDNCRYVPNHDQTDANDNCPDPPFAADPECGRACDDAWYTTEFRRGDANEDGAPNIADAIYVLQYLFMQGPPIRCLDAADANDDEAIDISDAIYTLMFQFCQGPRIPPPYGCGPDPTPHPRGEPDLRRCRYPRDRCHDR